MKTLILDGSVGADPTSSAVHAALLDALRALGATVESVRVSEKHIGPCMGDFFCWVRSPGQCAQDDDNRTIARAFARSDLVVFLTPVTFGGYSSELKRALDHMIQNISPFFAKVGGETHHAKRYARYPRIMAVGWLPAADAAAEAIFHRLVERNALNTRAPVAVSGVVHDGWEPERLREVVAGWLDRVRVGSGRTRVALPSVETTPVGAPPRRALLLTGSPRGRKSTSQSLGGYLFDRLEGHGVWCDTIRLYTVLKSEERQRALLRAVEESDLVTLAFPLYVDCLPAPVISILELIAAHRREAQAPRAQAFAAVSNCGFPEATHNETALAICGTFARTTGFEWAGGLGLGAGQGIVNGVPLAELGDRGAAIRASLDQAARALATGQAVPEEAMALMARPTIPPLLYRLLGGVSWRRQARHHGAQRDLKARPYT